MLEDAIKEEKQKISELDETLVKCGESVSTKPNQKSSSIKNDLNSLDNRIEASN